MAGPTKSKKSGRNDAKALKYKNAARQELNQLRGLIRHAKRLSHLMTRTKLAVFSPNSLGKDVAAAYAKINAKVPNHQIKQVCEELGVRLA